MLQFPNEESKWTWLAGIMDCDSCITMWKSKARRFRRGCRLCLRIRLEQTNRDLIEEIVRVTGTNTFNHRKGSHPNSKLIWRCTIYSNSLRVILPKIIPFLIKKNRQAILVLEGLALLSEHKKGHTPHDKRLNEIYNELHTLNKRGVK